MIHDDRHQTFHGLPLTSEQEAEVRHYLNRQRRLGKPWNTPELRAMLKDMLLPPSTEDDGRSEVTQEAAAAAERAATLVGEAMEPIEAHEEWIAAMEAESMKKDAH
ncbi:hypothetical protein KN198_05615 [Ralstonia solanacearum]|nr:hypothetical protein KN198_05615 [Ralstonia solanacearum]